MTIVLKRNDGNEDDQQLPQVNADNKLGLNSKRERIV